MKKFLKAHLSPSAIDKLCSVHKCYRRIIRGITRRIIERRTLRATMKKAVQRKTLRSSISDNGYYPLICYLASRYENIFRDFKRNYIYNQILEIASEREEYGRHFLSMIDEIPGFSLSAEDWREFGRNDLYGNPRVYPFRISGEDIMLSTSTIRYVKVLGDIVSMFDTENVKAVAEIGAGYGGQCRILMSRLDIEQFTLFDLPEVVGLCERYLQNYPECSGKIRYVDGGHIYIGGSYDLVISNYAFSELARSVQDMYLEKVVLKSKRGYMVWNDMSAEWMDGYTSEEFLKIVPGSSSLEIDYSGKCLIVWGNK